MNELTNPLQSLLKTAAHSLPAKTGETESFARRFAGTSGTTVILCDVSGSMDERAGARTKIEHLREALSEIWDASRGERRLIAFANAASEVQSPAQLPAPGGGTALHVGLDRAAACRPVHTVVISDGEPDSEDSALEAADRLSGKIDVIYCGSDSNARAVAFMRKLARVGCGSVVVADVVKAASGAALMLGCRKLLNGPAK